MDSRETGLFKFTDDDGSIYYLSIYVDDWLCTGPKQKRVDELIAAVLGKFKGRVIEPTSVDSLGRQYRDVLGMDVTYGPFYLKMTMKSSIEKIVVKYNLDKSASVNVPVVPLQPNNPDLAREAGAFPIRECVGALLHV